VTPIKEVFAPHLNRTVKLGRRRPVAHGIRMKFGSYKCAALPPPPDSADYSAKAMSALSLVYMNDQLGDCVIAGGYHVVGVETGNANGGSPFIATTDQILADYKTIGGYIPGNPNTDNGCDEETALDYWRQHGFANGTKIQGFLALDASNPTQVQQAMFLFENLYFGVELPDAWINPFPSASGFTWDAGQPDPDNGHCFVGVGYNQVGVQIDTWGLIGTVTWAAVEQLCLPGSGGQLFTLLTPDQIAKAQAKAPNGFSWDTLQIDFNALAPPSQRQ
jgi:hypothetical protein